MRFRGSIHVQPGVVVPEPIQHDLSASLKFMFETKIDGSLILNAYDDLKRRIRWRWLLSDQIDNEYDPDYEVIDKDKEIKLPPMASRHIENGLASGQEYITQVVNSIPEQKQKQLSHKIVDVKRAREFLVTNNLIVTNTDKNLGVAVFQRDWIINQTLTILEDVDTYTALSPREAVHHLNYIARHIEELQANHLHDEKQLSTFLSHCIPSKRDTWEDWAKFVPEMYAIPKIHKNPWKGRPICPGYSLPQNPASKVLSKMVRPFIDQVPWIIQGSKDFVRKLNDVKIPVGEKAWIISADVVAFYPSIPNEGALSALDWIITNILVPSDLEQGIVNSLDQINLRTDFYRNLFKIALMEPVMTFLDKMFTQHKGIPMGTAGSPDVANAYGYYHERMWMSRVEQDESILFYGRYLDDIHSIVTAPTAEEAKAKVSFINLGDVQLLWEEPSSTVNFLDLTVTIDENGISHKPFTKNMSHRERIPWSSAHPKDVKKGTFASEISRLATLCSHKETYLHQCKEAVNLYIGRGYPPAIVNSWLKEQVEKRWEDRLAERKPGKYDGSTLFTLKTFFNDAWKYVNVHELETKIKTEWVAGLPPSSSILGKRKVGFTPDMSAKKRKTTKDALHRSTAQLQALGYKVDEVKTTWSWFDHSKFLISRKRNKQLWDVTRTWNRQIYSNYLLETNKFSPTDPLYVTSIDEDHVLD